MYICELPLYIIIRISLIIGCKCDQISKVKYMRVNNKKSTIIPIFVVLGFLISTLGIVVAEENDETKIIKRETGTTQLMGGGDYVFIKFNEDSVFGVIYGTEENPNSIVTIALHTRYLGGAEVYDENGASLGEPVPIKVLTILSHKLDDVFEFNDTNEDGICNYKRLGPGMKRKSSIVHEPIYKKVSLETTWKRSDITETTKKGGNERTWEFSLKAENLKYEAVGDSESIQDDVENEVLEKIEFTFHLEAKLVNINDAIVPMYDVRVKRGDNSYDIIDSNKIEDKTISGKKGKYKVKYGHEIDGWDFDQSNENPFLLIEQHAVVGNLISDKANKWLKKQFIEQINGEGNVIVEDEEGRKTFPGKDAMEENKFNDRIGDNAKPRKMKSKYIEFGGNWEKIGRFNWVSNVTVDGEEREMYAQFQGIVKLDFKNNDGNYFYGFAVLAGLSYPGGQNIYHDPEMSSEVLIESQSFNEKIASPSSTNRRPWLLGIVAFGLIGTAGLAYTKQKENKEKFYHDQYDMIKPKKEEKSWEEFYEKK